ncbi:hypothetical protein [Streptomyces olivaceus]|uniref:hypothetical protein n=1 Tax=Streptomyces olivaceus TaxID=47716 RepID=UPI003715AC54
MIGTRAVRQPGRGGDGQDVPVRPAPAAVALLRVHDQGRQFLDLSDRRASRLTREQKSRFVATCWTAQMYKHFENPMPGHVANWAELPDWQRETAADTGVKDFGAGSNGSRAPRRRRSRYRR